MGQAGQAHVAAHFDWSAVIPEYLDLATELAARRAASQSGPGQMPLQLDPFALYAGYPSQTPDADWIATPRRPLDAEGLAALDRLNGRALYGRRHLGDARIVAVSETVAARGPLPIANLAKHLSLRADHALGAVLFLAKYDYLKLDPPKP